MGSPTELYRAPANAFVYDFLGGVNKLPVKISTAGAVSFDNYVAERPDLAGLAGSAIAYVRAEDITIDREGANGIPAVVEQVFGASAAPRAELRLADGAFLEVVLRKSLDLNRGAHVTLRPDTFRVFAPD